MNAVVIDIHNLKDSLKRCPQIVKIYLHALDEKLFEQLDAKKNPPVKSGWYPTDKGELWWMKDEHEWSCRDDILSEEYPKFWYQKTKLITPDI